MTGNESQIMNCVSSIACVMGIPIILETDLVQDSFHWSLTGLLYMSFQVEFDMMQRITVTLLEVQGTPCSVPVTM